MRIAILALWLAAALQAQNARPTRQEIAVMEKTLDQRLQRWNVERPVEVLGLTRGVYLDGFGVVFSAEVNLMPWPGFSPFRGAMTPEEAQQLRQHKLKRVPQIRALMQEMLVQVAQSLERLPAGEQVALVLLLWSHPREDAAGMPRLIQMQARRDALLEVAEGRRPKSALAQIVRVREE